MKRTGDGGFARLHNHPAAGLKFIKAFDTVEEALEYQDLTDPHKNPNLPPEVYEVLVVELAGFRAAGSENADAGDTD